MQYIQNHALQLYTTLHKNFIVDKMKLSHCRKLLQVPIIQPSKSNESSSSSSSTADNDRKPLQMHFDSSMALTLFAILITLFFVAFLSMYLGRRNSANGTAVSRRRRYSFSYQEDFKGLSPRTVRSLPLVCYGGDAEQGIINGECVVCLSEFEVKEMVKMIPFCRHVFHPLCIDTWLDSHVSCPLCRSVTIFAAGV